MYSYNIINYNDIDNNNNNDIIIDINKYIAIIKYNNIICFIEEKSNMDKKTSIQLSTETRDRLYKLKFRKTYDEFLNELCDLYELQYEAE